MRTKAIVTAVTATLKPTLTPAQQAHAAEQAMRKDAAILAFGIAVVEGMGTAISEWEQFVIAVAYGATVDHIKAGAARAIRQEFAGRVSKAASKGKAEEIASWVASGKDNPHVQGLDIDGAADAVSLMLNRARQYAHRVGLLQAAGETLLSAEGVVKDGLQTKARKLQEAARKPRGTKKRTDGASDDTGKGEGDNALVSSEANPANVALTDSLVGRVMEVLTMQGEAGERMRATFANSIMQASGMIALGRLKVEVTRASKAKAKAAEKARADAKVQADAEALAAEAQATAESSGKALRGAMKRNGNAPKGAKAKATTKQRERIRRQASSVRAVTQPVAVQ